jgi:uncharacterized protein (TIGR02117 family)
MAPKTSSVIVPLTHGLVMVLVLVWCAGCTASGTLLYPVQDQEEPKLIYVISHGWHTGIAAKRDDVDAHLWPEKDDFPEALYLEVGWGDRDFYRTPRAGVGILLQAALGSPASVVFVIGIPTTVSQYFPRGDIIEIALSRRGLEELATFVHATYKRDATGKTMPLGPGHWHQHSIFYLAEGQYSLFNTCNSWTSQALQAAGLPIRKALKTGGLMRQLQRYGRVIQRHATSADQPASHPHG